METSTETGKEAILSGIKKDAESEAARILEDSRRRAEDRKESAEKQAKSIVREAEKSLADQKESIRRSVQSGQENSIKRMHLTSLDRVIREVVQKAEEKLERMIEDPAYRKVILEWIVEAGVGLDTHAAGVRASAKEELRIDDDLLKEARKRIEELTGRPIALARSEERPMTVQGVVLSSEDGKRAYNNLVKTRIERYRTEIRDLIYRRVFDEDYGVHHE